MIQKTNKQIPQNYTAQHKHHAELLQSMSLCPTFMQDCNLCDSKTELLKVGIPKSTNKGVRYSKHNDLVTET